MKITEAEMESADFVVISCISLKQGCTTHGPLAWSGPRRTYIRPSGQVKKYKKLLLNDRDFMNEFKLHWTVNNFLTYYNPKQLWWHLCQTTSNKMACEIKEVVFLYSTVENSAQNFLFGPRENWKLRPLELRPWKLRPLAQKVVYLCPKATNDQMYYMT